MVKCRDPILFGYMNVVGDLYAERRNSDDVRVYIHVEEECPDCLNDGCCCTSCNPYPTTNTQVQQEAVDLSNWAAHYSINPTAVEALRSIIRPPAPVQAAHPSACEVGAVRELPAKWRKMVGESWNGSHVRDCADELESALAQADRVEHEAACRNRLNASGVFRAQAPAVRVTDEMVRRAFDAFANVPQKMGEDAELELMRAALKAALGQGKANG